LSELRTSGAIEQNEQVFGFTSTLRRDTAYVEQLRARDSRWSEIERDGVESEKC